MYKIILAKRADQMLLRHTEFLSRVSLSATRKFYQEFEVVLQSIEDNPHQFPVEDDMNLPDGKYRKALFAQRYKAVFSVEEKTVYLDAVIDCRMDTKKTF